ncbi:MAG TPA: alpha/beta fold hydrolase [Streptosporangiaceae bacterium]|nr:alpha/beta fold hydrolase [Streptosporangiaceae bacterium]
MTNPIDPAQHLADATGAVLGMPAGAAPTQPWPGSMVSLDVGEVFVRSAPAAPGAEPALLVHGLGGSALNWTDLMGLLSESAEDQAAGAPATEARATDARATDPRVADPLPLACEALDLPGFGYSPPPADANYSVDAHAAAVVALIERRGNWPVHLIGNSLGGAISTRVAARRPDLVRTLTLISPALPDLRPRLLPARLALVALPGVGRWLLTKMIAMPPEQRTEASIAELYADPSRMRPERRAEAIAEVERRDALDYSTDALLGSARALVAEYTKPGPASLWHDAALVTAPTLLIYGSHDRLVNPAMAGRAARTFRDGRAVVLPRIGHVAMMERPDLVAAEMREFLHGIVRDQVAQHGQARVSTAWPGGPRATATSGRGRLPARGGRPRAGVPGWALGLRGALSRISR